MPSPIEFSLISSFSSTDHLILLFNIVKQYNQIKVRNGKIMKTSKQTNKQNKKKTKQTKYMHLSFIHVRTLSIVVPYV